MSHRALSSLALVLAIGLTIPGLATPRNTSAASEISSILAQARNTGPTVDILVGARPGRGSALASLARGLGERDKGTVRGLNVRRLRVPAEAAAALMKTLERDSSVAFVERDAPVTISLTPNDPYYPNGYEWGLDLIGAPAAWDKSTGTNGPIIAVIDTGVAGSHPDLGGRVLAGYDFVNNDADPADDNGHGTHVAGIIAATGDNGIGGAGVCWGCAILPVKVLDAGGSGWYSTVAAGVTWAADNGARIINLSLGGNSQSATLASAVSYAQSKGIIVVAAAGNDGVQTRAYPAALPGVIAVAASTRDPIRYDWSNYGADWVAVTAPGCTTSTFPGDTYHDMCGTSMATPFVSGSLGLLLTVSPDATPVMVVNALLGTAGPALRDISANGVIHLDDAVTGLLSGDPPTPIPTATPTPSPTPIPTETTAPTPTPVPTPSPTPTPVPTPSPTPTPVPTPSPTPTPSPSATPTPTASGDFALPAVSATRSIRPGEIASWNILITRTNFSDSIDLDVTGLPAGMSADFSADPTDGASSVLTITTTNGAPTGTHHLTIVGTSAGLIRTTTATLVTMESVPPTVSAPRSYFTAGTGINGSLMRVHTDWNATDTSGITDLLVQRQSNGGGWAQVALTSATSSATVQDLTIGVTYRYRVMATDSVGNSSSWVYGDPFVVKTTQQSGSSVKYRGTWRTVASKSASGKSLSYAKVRGASATYRFTGRAVAWTAYRGPHRGKAKVYIDGVYKGTINLFAKTNQARPTAYTFRWSSIGVHTIKIVALGTSGRPRIDLDAFVRISAS